MHELNGVHKHTQMHAYIQQLEQINVVMMPWSSFETPLLSWCNCLLLKFLDQTFLYERQHRRLRWKRQADEKWLPKFLDQTPCQRKTRIICAFTEKSRGGRKGIKLRRKCCIHASKSRR
mmetsp:Transcript_42988/g.69753  ORF Transcript_42988/g.69753 Transcript_42988/m.69753 type:complete len:119 (+) Transcript_42988:540-896(+)